MITMCVVPENSNDCRSIYELAIKHKRLLPYLNGQYTGSFVDFRVHPKKVEVFKRMALKHYKRKGIEIREIVSYSEIFNRMWNLK